MSAATDTLLDKLGDTERQLDDALAGQAAADARLDRIAEAAELIAEHADDLAFVRQLREQLEAIGLTPDELAGKAAALSAGPVGRLLGLGAAAGRDDGDRADGPLFG